MTISKPEPINSSIKDFYTEGGARLSLPIYLDPPMAVRKQLLNGVRTKVMESKTSDTTPNTLSGISVSSIHNQPDIETYIGMSIDVLRAVLFQRGGLPIDMFIRLQHITGIRILTEKEIKSAFDARKKVAIACLSDNPFANADELAAAV